MFGEDIKYLKRGIKVAKQSWHKSGIYFGLQIPDVKSKLIVPYIYIIVDGNYHIPWYPSKADAWEDDRRFFYLRKGFYYVNLSWWNNCLPGLDGFTKWIVQYSSIFR
ncbi:MULTISPECIES: MW1434 family type I TA system toxin [Clostridia]|uniref:Thoeris anti-defense Tad2 family protein n=1 Tax=Clostridia TaxID=186801 RepID=UPI0015FD188A|nr:MULTISPECIES: MW1434 family type I TA system toxin [Clostridia]